MPDKNVKIKEILDEGIIRIEDDLGATDGGVIHESGRAYNSRVTGVDEGDKIIWKKDAASGIKEILAVFPEKKNGRIFNGQHATRNGDEFFTIVPNNILKAGEQMYLEKYYIVYRSDKKYEPVIVDPTVKVPGS